jgi:hypothetical protein
VLAGRLRRQSMRDHARRWLHRRPRHAAAAR